MNFICNCRNEDIEKIQRLGFSLIFSSPQATPGFSAEANAEAGLVGVYVKESSDG